MSDGRYITDGMPKAPAAPPELRNDQIIAWPESWPKVHNACTDPCDAFVGPCACGGWHKIEDLPRRLAHAPHAQEAGRLTEREVNVLREAQARFIVLGYKREERIIDELIDRLTSEKP